MSLHYGIEMFFLLCCARRIILQQLSFQDSKNDVSSTLSAAEANSTRPALQVYNNFTIQVCSIIETGNPNIVVDYNKLGAAIRLGFTEANEKILPTGISLNLNYKNGGATCSPRNNAFRSYLELTDKNIRCDVYIGPGCDDAAGDINAIALSQNVPLLACPAANVVAASGQDRGDLSHMIRTAYSYTSICDTLYGLLYDTHNYTDWAIFIDSDNIFYNDLGTRIRSYLRINKPLIKADYQYTRGGLLGNESTIMIKRSLVEANKKARVILLFGPALFVRSVMIMAVNQSMTKGDHIYIGIELYRSNLWGDFRWKLNDVNDRYAKEGYKSLLLFCIHEPTNSMTDAFEKAVRTHSRALKTERAYAAFENVDPVATGYYYAFILYANAVRAIHEERGNISDTSALLGKMRNVTYKTSFGQDIAMNTEGDKKIIFAIKDFDLDLEIFQVALTIAEGNRVHALRDIHISCPDGRYLCGFPPNTPRCGFTGSLCNLEDPVSIGSKIAMILCGLAICAAVITYLIYRRFREEVDPFWWKLDVQDIRTTNRAGKSVTSLRRSGSSLFGEKDSSETDTDNHKSIYSHYIMVTYRNQTITVTALPEQQFRVSKELVKEMNAIRTVRHQNLQKFLGLAVDVHNVCHYRTGELCSRGTLEDVLESDSLKLDWSFKYSLIKDIAEGMTFLHSTSIDSHGFLSAISCLVDSRFVVKVTDYGITLLRDPIEYKNLLEESDTDRSFRILLWRAPELLRQIMPKKGTQAADAVQEDNFGSLSDRDIVWEVKKSSAPPFRPVIPALSCSSELKNLIVRCWAEVPTDRPTFVKIRDSIRKIAGAAGENIIDHLIQEMQQYANTLEDKVAQQTQHFMEEKDRTEALLSQLLPKSVAAALTKGETVDPECYDVVTIYFSDIVGFTSISAQGSAMDVVALLNNLYTLFDAVLANYDAYKVETIGDAYMIVSGLPLRNETRHAHEIACVALSIVEEIGSFKIPHLPDRSLQIRVGLNSGSCVAGVVGMKMPKYCLFGDTVVIASRMESSGEPMKIQITQVTKDLLDLTKDFVVTTRGEINVKDKGIMMTYWLKGKS